MAQFPFADLDLLLEGAEVRRQLDEDRLDISQRRREENARLAALADERRRKELRRRSRRS